MQTDDLKKSTEFFGIYRGKVIDNVDPNKLGRIKIQVYPMFSGISTTDVPWAIPAYSISEGSGSGIGNFAVPELNTLVYVFFEEGDVYQPVYFLEAPSAVHGLPTERLINYPNRKVLKTRGGFLVYFDETDQVFNIQHPSGSFIRFDSLGNIIFNSIGNISMIAENNISLVASNNIIVSSTNTVTITGDTGVDINP